MADLLQLFKGSLEFLQPSLEKISLAFFMLFVVFLGLLIDIPEWAYLPLMTILAWPLLGLAQLCGQSDLECQNAASFVGLLLSLLYWYLAACFLSWALENVQAEEAE
ncbi:MAG TPA: hypothetical protein VJI13_03645 [Candidatus Norongarragalinales archaeon]|nr:hypothetical protein [Candidatus Norongarragalinales archaeon]